MVIDSGSDTLVMLSFVDVEFVGGEVGGGTGGGSGENGVQHAAGDTTGSAKEWDLSSHHNTIIKVLTLFSSEGLRAHNPMRKFNDALRGENSTSHFRKSMRIFARVISF